MCAFFSSNEWGGVGGVVGVIVGFGGVFVGEDGDVDGDWGGGGDLERESIVFFV